VSDSAPSQVHTIQLVPYCTLADQVRRHLSTLSLAVCGDRAVSILRPRLDSGG
jgi:hypothetical protein